VNENDIPACPRPFVTESTEFKNSVDSVYSDDSVYSIDSVDSVTNDSDSVDSVTNDSDSVDSVTNGRVLLSVDDRMMLLGRLARECKGESDAVADHEQAVRDWYCRRSSMVVDLPSFSEVWSEFRKLFKRTKCAIGEGPIEKLLSAELAMPPEASEFADEPRLQHLIAILAALQDFANQPANQKRMKGEFYLSSRKAGQAIGTDPVAAWRWLDELLDLGYLIRTKKGTAYRAARWRWVGRG
jgi:hypothetical protein